MNLMSEQKKKNFIDDILISDVYLKNSLTSIEKGFKPSREQASDLVFFKKHIIVESEVISAQENENDALLLVYLEFGIRFAEKESEEDIKGSIEASFIVEYKINKQVNGEEIDRFVFECASSHAWPHWLEFLNSQINRMRLPAFRLPAFDSASNKEDNI